MKTALVTPTAAWLFGMPVVLKIGKEVKPNFNPVMEIINFTTVPQLQMTQIQFMKAPVILCLCIIKLMFSALAAKKAMTYFTPNILFHVQK